MIIELFGPPGSGKTTFAHALAAALKERAATTELILSYRPAERVVSLDSCATAPAQAVVARRLARPIVEVLALARHPLVNVQGVISAVNLVRKLPPRTVLSALREVQYIARLSNSWHRASHAPHIVVFDQAYVQAVYSLALLSGVTDETLLADALKFAPKPDLLIRLEAPLEVLRARLHHRKCLQGAIERLFELRVQADPKSMAITERLSNALRERGQPVTCIASLDEGALRQGVKRTVRQIMGKMPALHRDVRDGAVRKPPSGAPRHRGRRYA
jgi:thymidylate kinase